MIKCSKCGKEIQDNINFCPECGSKIENNICASCGAELAESQKFCTKCGTARDDNNIERKKSSKKTNLISVLSSFLKNRRKVVINVGLCFCSLAVIGLLVYGGFSFFKIQKKKEPMPLGFAYTKEQCEEFAKKVIYNSGIDSKKIRATKAEKGNSIGTKSGECINVSLLYEGFNGTKEGTYSVFLVFYDENGDDKVDAVRSGYSNNQDIISSDYDPNIHFNSFKNNDELVEIYKKISISLEKTLGCEEVFEKNFSLGDKDIFSFTHNYKDEFLSIKSSDGLTRKICYDGNKFDNDSEYGFVLIYEICL